MALLRAVSSLLSLVQSRVDNLRRTILPGREKHQTGAVGEITCLPIAASRSSRSAAWVGQPQGGRLGQPYGGLLSSGPFVVQGQQALQDF